MDDAEDMRVELEEALTEFLGGGTIDALKLQAITESSDDGLDMDGLLDSEDVSLLAWARAQWVGRAVAAGFRSWWEITQDMIRQRMCARGALNHWLQKELAAAFNSWREIAENLALQRSSLRGALGHMMNRQLSAGMNTWREHCANLMEQQALLRRSLLHWVHMAMFEKWVQWREYAQA